MRKLPLIITAFIFSFSVPVFSFAQGMMGQSNTGSQNDDGHTAREEAEGKAIWEKLQAKELKCEDLNDGQFGALGEYYMGQMAGDSHEAMNRMMTQMAGEEGEEQMHVVMGKRMSNCDSNAPLPQSIIERGMMPMMVGMMGNGSNPPALNNFNNPLSMMNLGFAPYGWIFMILFWILVIVVIVALLRWLTGQRKTEETNTTSALGVLKARYAKGEIDKKEFEEKKKDLS